MPRSRASPALATRSHRLMVSRSLASSKFAFHRSSVFRVQPGDLHPHAPRVIDVRLAEVERNIGVIRQLPAPRLGLRGGRSPLRRRIAADAVDILQAIGAVA